MGRGMSRRLGEVYSFLIIGRRTSGLFFVNPPKKLQHTLSTQIEFPLVIMSLTLR